MRKMRMRIAVVLSSAMLLGSVGAFSSVLFADDEIQYASEEFEASDYDELAAFSDDDAEAENNDGDDTYISNDGTTFRIPRASDPNERVFDYAGIFTKEQQDDLREGIAKLEEEKDADVILLVTNDVPYDLYDGTETSQKYLRQFYIDNGYRTDGAGFIIDLNNRVLWSIGSGKYCNMDFVDFAEEVYNDCLGAARKGDYYEAAKVFLDDLYKYKNPLNAMIPTGLSLIISLVLSLLAVLGLNVKHKSSQPSRATKPEIPVRKFDSIRHDEKYLGTTVTRRHIPKDNNSGSGGGFSGGISSGGFSSGGGSFSGGGGKF